MQAIIQHWKILLYLTSILLGLSNFTWAEVITNVTVYEKAGVTTANYPLTFGQVFKKGDVPQSVQVTLNDQPLPTQFDIKRHWDDGSVKHGVISVIIPQMPANGSVNLILETNDNANNTGGMDKAAILATNVESRIDLSNLSGSQNPSTATASLRNILTNTSNLEYWLQGNVCTEILADTPLTPNNNLHARWEARFYPGTSFGIRISTSVESVDLNALGNSDYTVSIKLGSDSPTEAYRYENYSHPYGSRWRKVLWLGSQPPETELHYNTDYLIATGMIPPLDTSITVPESYIDKLYSIYKTKRGEIRGGDDIDGSGNIYRAMPMVGGRDELGIIPTWQAVYLLTYDNKAREIVLGNGNISGQIGSMHYSEGNSANEFYRQPAVSINSRPMVTLFNLSNDIPTPVGDIPRKPNSWHPDRSHQPSVVYLPYIITGEKFYADELSYWASYDIGYSFWARNGHGDTFDFSSSFSGYDAGIIHDETRGVAWAMRNIADAVVILPETMAPLISYFKNKLNNTFTWLEMANTGDSQGVHFILVSRRAHEGTYPHMDAPWQHDFNVIVLNDIIRKKEAVLDLNALVQLRDYLGYFTIGRLANDPDFKKYDGVGYYFPVTKQNGTAIENNWSKYYAECLRYWSENSSRAGGAPHIKTFPDSWINDPESYIYVAQAALAGLTHLPNGVEALKFIKDNTKSNIIYQKPQWGGLVPMDGYTVSSRPIIQTISIE